MKRAFGTNPKWLLEQHMLEDMNSEMLYQNATDGLEGDVELNMQLA